MKATPTKNVIMINRIPIAILVALPLFILAPMVSHGQDANRNYALTKTYTQESSGSHQATVTYYDGLGRPIQQVANAQGGNGEDLITHMEYDDLGRQEKEYLPYTRSSPSLGFDTGVSSGLSSQYGGGSFPYSEKEFEASPLGRVLRQAAPSSSTDGWEMDSSHEVKFRYLTNGPTEVYRFSISSGLPVLTGVDHYGANQLYKTVTYDENNDTMNTKGSVVEYRDKLGRVVLKRTYTTSSGRTNETNPAVAMDTYYIYDDFGNLAVVLPPKLSEQVVESGPSLSGSHLGLLNHLGYRYRYDHRNRLVQKKLPGKDKEFIAYDPLDRVIATGPAISPLGDGSEGWLHTKYDPFGRVAYTFWTGGSVSGSSRNTIENNQSAPYSETRTSPNNQLPGDVVGFGYTNTVAPTGSGYLLTVNYYDDYDWDDAPSNIPSTVGTGDVNVHYDGSNPPRGMPTGSWIRILTGNSGDTDGKLTHTLYDKKGRAVRVHTDFPGGGYTQVDTKYDFVGKPLYTITKHRKDGTAQHSEITVRENFTYDSQERLESHGHVINGGAEQLLAKIEYDGLGQLTDKMVGGTDMSGSNAFQHVDYNYNIRGWLTNINNLNDLGTSGQPTDLFAFRINYNSPLSEDINGQVEQLYNGNISETYWRTSSDNEKRKYGYTYDYLNRLLDAWYQKPDHATPILQSYDEHLTYDSNGNILTLQRNGVNELADPALEIDDLRYTYDTGNKLESVYDGSLSTDGFNDGNTGSDDYDYDGYGNLVEDKNKGITAIVYNHLNLPAKVTFGSQGDIEYIYDASGVKLKKTVKEGTTVTGTTDYMDGFQYNDGELDFFAHAEGTVEVTPSELSIGGPDYNYVFHYVDHLGNIRVRYALDPDDGALNILEEKHYYPFGLQHEGYNQARQKFGRDLEDDSITLTPVDPFLGTTYNYGYNGKEEQEELGLNWIDYGARNYDAALGRWMNVDNLAEDYFSLTPYNYVDNNPIFFIDPDGQRIIFGFQTDRDGNRIGEQEVKDVINSGLGGGDIAQIDADGNLTLNLTKEQRSNLNDEQSAFLGVLEEGINAKDADGNSADVNIGIVKNHIDIVVGGADSKLIDIGDISNVNNGEAVTQQSFFGHEVKEQFEIQVGTNGEPVDKHTAHNRAESVEADITGYTRTGTIGKTTQTIIPRSEKRGLMGLGLRDPYRKARTGTVIFTYNNGNKTIKATMHVKNGNVTKVDQR
ncbi:DUF6443 domain-containing protein [Flavobacteriaceae bacterium TK19130]|nr:DUF6443 domain-containing protein [Thermobacterium salinum]